MKISIRKYINLISLAISFIALYFLIVEHNLFISLGFLLFSAVLFLPRIIYKKLDLKEKFGVQLLDWLEVIFSFSIILSVGGYLWLFDKLYDYDAYVHFFIPLLLFILIAITASAILQYNEIKNNKSDIILLSLVIVISLLLLWELFEYFVTTKLNINLFFTDQQPRDTLYDVIIGFLSLQVGSVIVYKYHDLFFKSIRKK